MVDSPSSSAHPATVKPLPPEALTKRIEARPARSRVSADKGHLLSTFRELWTYLWPRDRADLRLRILWATILLVIAKLVTLAVPFTFKWATDALAPLLERKAAGQTFSFTSALYMAPLMLTLAYGAMRVMMALLTQLRDALFASVAMHAV
ncbi:MAG: hypothetical protein NTZ22_00440, partial [Hyphomicrobiales bacterium]|nr:hypothetical protein [Hyphomicrobiales bacterium]